MYIPYIYSALWIYFCIYSKKHNKKIICKKNVILLSVTLLIPFILGFIYHITPGIYNIFNVTVEEALKNATDRSAYLSGRGFSSYGYIYCNFYSNLLLFIPLLIYFVYKRNKEKKLTDSFEIICFVALLLFVVFLIICIAFGKVSFYYTMKNYYILWLIMIFINFRGLMYLYEKNKRLPYIFVSGYVILLILSLIFIKVP